jgi:hypothetical protein
VTILATTRSIALGALSLLAACGLGSCGDSTGPGLFAENVDITVCDPSKPGFTLAIDNPYFPLVVGTQWVLDGVENGVTSHLVITVLDSTENVAGVPTRVVEERQTDNGELVEVSHNFFVQASGGSVCYFGEDVDQGGVVVNHGGQWRAGVNGFLPGMIMPAAPAVGMAFRAEIAPGVAEDRFVILALGESTTVPAGTFTATVRFRETTPLDPSAADTKVFAQGIGPIVDDVLKLTAKTP